MITAFDVYLVMLMGDVQSALCMAFGAALAFSGLFRFGVIFTFLGADGNLSKSEQERGDKMAAASWLSLKWAAAFLVVATVLPDSKTLAAMYILPAMTSDAVIEPVSAEAKELYTLAKKALNKIADEPAKVEQEAAK